MRFLVWIESPSYRKKPLPPEPARNFWGGRLVSDARVTGCGRRSYVQDTGRLRATGGLRLEPWLLVPPKANAIFWVTTTYLRAPVGYRRKRVSQWIAIRRGTASIAYLDLGRELRYGGNHLLLRTL